MSLDRFEAYSNLANIPKLKKSRGHAENPASWSASRHRFDPKYIQLDAEMRSDVPMGNGSARPPGQESISLPLGATRHLIVVARQPAKYPTRREFHGGKQIQVVLAVEKSMDQPRL